MSDSCPLGYLSNVLAHVLGTQLWPDGSQYEGQFDNDLRHGDGQHTWTNQEVRLNQKRTHI